MPGQRSQIAFVQGRVGVLLRVDDPDHRVDQGEHPVHLLPVARRRRVVVGQVHQDEPLERLVRGRAALHRPAPQSAGDGQPVEQPGGAVGPAAGDRGRGGRPAQSGVGDLDAGERVEEGGLPAAGGSRDGDDRVPGGEPLAGRRLVEHAPRLGEGVPVQPGAGESDQLAQRVQSWPQRAAGQSVRLDLGPGLVLRVGLAPGRQLVLGRVGGTAGDQPVVPAPLLLPGSSGPSRSGSGPGPWSRPWSVTAVIAATSPSAVRTARR